ncbi:MAG TPA: hypothetical protein VLN48_15985 [Bryobacteraceae bacterium]|nr:hypothetical protein [Bryobacteraceae bacterium]
MFRGPKAIWLILLGVAALYATVSTAFFCGYDDFFDIQRATFEDARSPVRIFTTTHFGSTKYRPIQRGLTYLSWHWGRQNPAAFRVRNLCFHLFAVAFVYGITWLLSKSRAAAAGAAALFGFHPLANQVIDAAVFGNTAAYALLLGSFFFFLYSLEEGRAWKWPLLSSLLCALLALFTYESTIVVFGFTFTYLFLAWWRGRSFSRAYFMTFLCGSGIVLLSLFVTRRLFVAQPTPLVPVGLMLRNTAMYIGALLLPVDPVFAHEVWGTPLPSEITLSGSVLAVLGAAAAALALLVLLALRTAALRTRMKRVDWPVIVLLATAIPFSLGPFLAFTGHASETYMYLPAALYAILLSLVLNGMLPSRACATVLSLLVISLAAGTWVRNQLVASCGVTAKSIISQLPLERWRTGDWNIRLARPVDEPVHTRYGLYGWEGLSTIDPGEPAIMPPAQAALRIFSGNDRVKAEVVPGDQLRDCTAPGTCFWVSRRGDVKDAYTSAVGN